MSTCQEVSYALLTVDNAQSHVTAFQPISEAARSWSDDKYFWKYGRVQTQTNMLITILRCMVVSVAWRMNEITLRRARLVLGWVTVFGRVYHLGV